MKVKEIAEFRELTTGTISNHLLHYVRTGDIKLQELVDQEKINYITAHLQKLSSLPQGVKEIKEKLGEYASYDEIRFVFEAYKTYTGINFIHIEVAKVSALHETSKYT